MLRLVALTVVLCGCGRIAFDSRDDAAVEADASACPPGYTFAGAGCYRFVELAQSALGSWLEAEADCEADGIGSHLVVIDSLAEAMVVDQVVPGTVVDHFIGASDLATEGVFISVTNMPLGYTNWDVGEPNNGTSQNCVVVDDALLFSSTACDSGDDYVCEYDGIAAVPAAWGQ